MRAVAFFLLLTFVVGGYPDPLFSQSPDQRDLFARAYSLYSNGNFSQAKELFQKTLDPKFVLADYSRFYLATIAFNEKNWDTSRQLLTELRQKYPQSIWFHAAELQRALSMHDLDVNMRLRRYALNRWQRNARVQARSQRNGRIFHATGPVRWGRDLSLRLLGSRLMDLPWLYRGDGSAANAL